MILSETVTLTEGLAARGEMPEELAEDCRRRLRAAIDQEFRAQPS